jgi:ribosome biogenesis GTPase
MNKSDLAEEHATEADWESMKIYEKLGYPVLHINAISGKDGEGIQELLARMNNKTSIFSGRSGVGKSSIANQLLPDIDITVGIISDSGEGKHTTTTANLYQLPDHNNSHGYLIDYPGVRDYALGDISPQLLSEGYVEIYDVALQCRFNNCTHDHEPGCAVRSAVENNEISKERYQRYLQALKNLSS